MSFNPMGTCQISTDATPEKYVWLGLEAGVGDVVAGRLASMQWQL